jgi:hypothetical protein
MSYSSFSNAFSLFQHLRFYNILFCILALLRSPLSLSLSLLVGYHQRLVNLPMFSNFEVVDYLTLVLGCIYCYNLLIFFSFIWLLLTL